MISVVQRGWALGVRCLRFSVVMVGVLLGSAAAPIQDSSSRNTQSDPGNHGRYVEFLGIAEPVKVAPLDWAAGKDPTRMEYALPTAVVDKVIRARDCNACWLICERREDYESVSYTYKFTSRSGKTYTYPYVGRYDRGIPLLLPSEFVLYYGDVSAYEYEDGPDYFKMIVKPDVGDSNHGIPDYVYWARPLWKPLGWMNTDEVTRFLQKRPEPQHHYGYEVWFSQEDMRLVRERVTAAANTEEGNRPRDYDSDKPVVLTEVDYAYAGDENWPVDVSIRNISSERSKAEFVLHFQMVDGLWMLRDGVLDAVLGGSRLESAYRTCDVSVHR